MLKSKSKFAIRYTPEFRRQMVELVRAGRKPSEVSREFGCTSWSINRWVAQAERDAGRGDGGLTLVTPGFQIWGCWTKWLAGLFTMTANLALKPMPESGARFSQRPEVGAA